MNGQSHYVMMLRLGACLFSIAACLVSCSRSPSREEIRALRTTLDSKAKPAYVANGAEGASLWQTLRRFYERRGYRPTWIASHRPLPKADDLIRALQKASEDGLDPATYEVDHLVNTRAEASGGTLLKKRSFDRAPAIDFEIRLTYTFLEYASHGKALSNSARRFMKPANLGG